MFLIDGALHWSASDLTAAATCEFAVLRRLDHKLGRVAALDVKADPLLDHIAALGDKHEARLLEQYVRAGGLVELPKVATPYTVAALEAAGDRTLAAFHGDADVLFQPAFFDGEFFGYADFVERTPDGWLVCDAKLARSAKPTALLQLGAYAEQLRLLEVPASSRVALLLGTGERAAFPVDDVLPVFRDHRARLRALLARHLDAGTPAVWGNDNLLACGRCGDCLAAAQASDDLILVAGLRRDQRRKLRAAGIRTATELSVAEPAEPPLPAETFENLRAQATLQTKHTAKPDAPPPVEARPTAATVLGLLPAPSTGDLFFDFEGDPLHTDGAGNPTGLEYLWGYMGPDEEYAALWAHDAAGERAALESFVDIVTARRVTHPGMHVYHYAPYETTALKRLAMRYQTREDELDELLRGEVFVDLYATVRGAVRVGTPSYSIKKLEPLYMGDELRSDDEDSVGDGGASVVAYHEYVELAADGDGAAAAKRLDALADYNEYDCLSTLRLRDWLLARAETAGLTPLVRTGPVIDDEAVADEIGEQDPLHGQLLARSGSLVAAERTAEEQAYALLAAALDYYRRERKQAWWDHFERLGNLVESWREARDVFVVESAEVVSDWAHPGGKAKNHRRTLQLVGDWTPGSNASSQLQVIYADPVPPGVTRPETAPLGAGSCVDVRADDDDPRVVHLVEGRKPTETYAETPVALAPSMPLRTAGQERALHALGASAAGAPSLPTGAAFDLLTRRAPRLRDGGSLPRGSFNVDDVVAALLAMDDSYVAVQGPPGTGKTWTGARVIKRLVEEHGWRVGVVAQSHDAVENLLGGLVAAGLDPARVGKSRNKTDQPSWTELKHSGPVLAQFLESGKSGGCVLGGTSWTFSGDSLVEPGGLDLLVVDEAGQFALAPTLAASAVARRLLLLGDPQQLPQVSQGSHPEPVDHSALGWLTDGHDTLPDHLGYFLADSYRMHPTLCSAVSRLSYDGRLTAAAPAAERGLAGIEPGVEVVLVDHAGNCTQSLEEAAEVARQVGLHVGRAWTGSATDAPRTLGAEDVLVVAPYNAQVQLIRTLLAAAGLTGVRVGTVDRFQGKEAPVVIVSTTASSRDDVPRGMSFLLNRNRINVAVSRAQWRAVVVRSRALTAFLPPTVTGLLELGGFLGLAEAPSHDDRVPTTRSH